MDGLNRTLNYPQIDLSQYDAHTVRYLNAEQYSGPYGSSSESDDNDYVDFYEMAHNQFFGGTAPTKTDNNSKIFLILSKSLFIGACLFAVFAVMAIIVK